MKLVGAGHRAGTLFRIGPAGTPGPTGFSYNADCEKVNNAGNCYNPVVGTGPIIAEVEHSWSQSWCTVRSTASHSR